MRYMDILEAASLWRMGCRAQCPGPGVATETGALCFSWWHRCVSRSEKLSLLLSCAGGEV